MGGMDPRCCASPCGLKINFQEMKGFDAQQDDVFRLVTQKMNKHRRIAIEPCLCTQSAFKQLSGGVLSVQFRGSAVGRWPPELGPAGSQDGGKKLKIELRAISSMLRLFSPPHT